MKMYNEKLDNLKDRIIFGTYKLK